MRRRYVWSPEANALVKVPTTFTQEQFAPVVINDLPDYTSPIDGRLVSGRKQRRNDLARTGSRPWEGKEQELKEAARRLAYDEQKSDRRLDESVRRAFHQLPPERRRILEGR